MRTTFESLPREGANIICLAFPAAFLFGTIALEKFQPGYDRISDTISELVWGPPGWIVNVLFMAFAAALVLFALRMREVFLPLAAASLGFAILAVFPTQAPGAGPSTASLIHQYSAQGIAATLPVACFCLAWKLRANEEYRFIVTCSITAGAIGLILNMAGFLALYGDTEWVGAAERLVMLNGLIWLQLLSVHLWLQKKPSSSRTDFPYCRDVAFAPICARTEEQPVMVSTTTINNKRSQWQ
jgi:hypothetical protein